MNHCTISREQALKLIENSSKRSHAILVSKIMRIIAKRLGKNEDEWELVGLLHDLDYGTVRNDMSKHGIVAAESLKGKLSKSALHAIKAHDHRTGFKSKSTLDKSLIAVDALAAFIEDLRIKKIPMDIKILKSRINNESLPKPWLKELILTCEDLCMSLEEFFKLGLEQSELISD